MLIQKSINVIHHSHKLKDTSRKTISTEAEKFFTKIQHPFKINFPESEHRRNLPQHNKGHIGEIHSTHYFQWWKTESLSSKTRNKIRMSTLDTTVQHSFGSPNHSKDIMRNAWLDESEAGIKIARRNINNLRYADHTTLMAESEREL